MDWNGRTKVRLYCKDTEIEMSKEHLFSDLGELKLIVGEGDSSFLLEQKCV